MVNAGLFVGLILRRLHRMDPAFGLGPAAPAAGARGLVGRVPTGAGHAPDRQITLRRERMRRQVCTRIDRLDLLARDVGERIEFQPAAIGLDYRYRGADAPLKTLAPI